MSRGLGSLERQILHSLERHHKGRTGIYTLAQEAAGIDPEDYRNREEPPYSAVKSIQRAVRSLARKGLVATERHTEYWHQTKVWYEPDENYQPVRMVHEWAKGHPITRVTVRLSDATIPKCE